jgi:ethanolamine utilization cobalamin adenosyltransferase
MLGAKQKNLQSKSDKGRICEMIYRTFLEMLDQAVLEDARKLIKAGADVELILLFLRDRGFDQIDSILTICALMGKSNDEAKELIHHSKAWSDRFYSVQHLHDKARQALLELAASGDKDLPRIELVGFDEEEP